MKTENIVNNLRSDDTPSSVHQSIQNSYFDQGSFSWTNHNPTSYINGSGEKFQEELDVSAGILEDPFDAEWAALAMRNATSKNPFLNDKNDGVLKKAFELQM